ncbi:MULTISPECIES: 5-formyltetrahydrofolate cyclo-ligase [unclassified Actinomyces]|uniref:5-formyltetrahydrofolate cyclo-ligase n=1 Tax=unclassified Actinomyces TaxID=2609248 RepID=UPI0013739668|nr:MULTISPECIES: 5-formyltetrahydrofolate cyclo-ligase [unclassified Actinomyces]MBW3068650.1 5-formyltetrahydrofolate cyclo-ligase [Actinomyces sp. 594]NDR54366.1 5-formyltetrahydrofolate cyclo-ligase [Actinomyces sp. 565]QHO90407.1 5-formyltetrahydrofolate cyclo-ligase [Actinomyces sp. 432]
MSTQARVLPDTSSLAASDAKEQLRQVLRRHRATHHRHPEHGHNSTCQQLTAHILQAIAGMSTVAAYVSVSHEPCTRLLLEQLEGTGTAVLLPVLGPQLTRSWGYFRGVADLAERSPGRPPEPSGEVLPATAIADAEAVIVPALAVDRSGRRLGQGGGWYDRVLPLRRRGTPIFAVVHDDELVTQPLPGQPHDAPVDAVITPDEWFLLEGSAFAGGAADHHRD